MAVFSRALAEELAKLYDRFFGIYRSAGIVGRIDDNCFGRGRDQLPELAYINVKIGFLGRTNSITKRTS